LLACLGLLGVLHPVDRKDLDFSMTDRTRFHRILIVDDIPANIQLLAGILESDYEIFFATTGERALEIAAEKDIDLILLDIMMPEVDGYEVCRRLKADPSLQEIPVIFVTAKTQVDDELKGFDVGAVDYIVKPISPPIVQARVKIHLELKTHRDYLRSLSNYDGITGIPNRRYLDEMLQRTCNQSRRSRTPLSMFMADIDYFKQYNDRYGHLAGDDCLKLVAQALSKALVRPADFIARYGGEEFAVICPETSAKDANMVAAKLLDAVGALAIPHEESAAAPIVTISIGGVTINPENPGREIEPANLIHRADTLLYKAKKNGRNQFWHEPISLGAT